MKHLLVAIASLFLACSTTKNPAKCVDGVCVDPGRPYCDFDGLIEGKPDTCIAVECVAGQLEACRADTAVKCNEGGTDFVNVECPLGCDPVSNGCRECNSNVQCPTNNPICDPGSNLCRECGNDDECDSKVCSAGRCVAESEIVYTAPNAFGSCSKEQPCALATAVFNARSSAKILRMLPATYTTQLEVTGINNTPLEIVATGATVSTLGDLPAVVIANGADVRIRNLNSLSERHFKCGSTTATPSAVTFDGGTFMAVGTNTAAEVERCSTTLSRMQVISPGGSSMYVLSDGAFELDRVFMSTNASQSITVVNAARARVKITNSLLVETSVEHFSSQDTQLPGTSFVIAYSTLISRGSSWGNLCGGMGMFRTIKFENSIIAGLGNVAEAFAINTPECAFVSTMIHPHQAAPLPGVLVQDPQFANGAADDFHLKPGSPAIDRASSGTVAPSLDFDGNVRGALPDLGAFERQ